MQLIKGFRDILPEDVHTWQMVEQEAVSLFKNFGFQELRIPILEKAELFAKSIGENTDIVEKEMYTFQDHKRGLVTLRPEATASVVRAYIQHRLYSKDPIQKLYTIGPMFRRERPQKGRYRQFYQINAEAFGIASPFIDVQIIIMLNALFTNLDLKDVAVKINSLGCPGCRPQFKTNLLEKIDSVSENLCSDCQRRQTKNPLRILDCKVPSCQESLTDMPSPSDFLCEACKCHFETVKKGLDDNHIPYTHVKRLVRGLDYYTRTIFEVQTGSLGAQNAVAGGGRYDGLVKSLGGPNQPAIGFAIGFDRLVALMTGNMTKNIPGPDIFIAALGDACMETAAYLMSDLAKAGISTETDFQKKSLKSLMKKADKIGASHVLMLGDDELAQNKLILRNMTSKDQVEIQFNGQSKEFIDTLKKIITE